MIKMMKGRHIGSEYELPAMTVEESKLPIWLSVRSYAMKKGISVQEVYYELRVEKIIGKTYKGRIFIKKEK